MCSGPPLPRCQDVPGGSGELGFLLSHIHNMGERRDSSLKPTHPTSEVSSLIEGQRLPLTPPQSPPSTAWGPQAPTVKIRFLPGSCLPEAPSLIFLRCCGPASFPKGPVAWRALVGSVMSLEGTRLWEMLHTPLLSCSLLWGGCPVDQQSAGLREKQEKPGAVGRGQREGRVGQALCWDG